MKKMNVIIPYVLLIIALFAYGEVTVANTQNDIALQEQPDNNIPYRDGEILGGDSIVRLALAVVIGVSFVVLATWGMRKIQHNLSGENGKTKKIRLIETRRITQKLTLMIIEVGNKTYVIAQNGENIVRIDAYDEKVSESDDA
jgi:hypothetical protein